MCCAIMKRVRFGSDHWLAPAPRVLDDEGPHSIPLGALLYILSLKTVIGTKTFPKLYFFIIITLLDMVII